MTDKLVIFVFSGNVTLCSFLLSKYKIYIGIINSKLLSMIKIFLRIPTDITPTYTISVVFNTKISRVETLTVSS